MAVLKVVKMRYAKQLVRYWFTVGAPERGYLCHGYSDPGCLFPEKL